MFCSNNIFDTFPGTDYERGRYMECIKNGNSFTESSFRFSYEESVDIVAFPVFPYSNISHLNLKHQKNFSLGLSSFIPMIVYKPTKTVHFCDTKYIIQNLAVDVEDIEFNLSSIIKPKIFNDFFLFTTVDQYYEPELDYQDDVIHYFLKYDVDNNTVEWYDHTFGADLQEIF